MQAADRGCESRTKRGDLFDYRLEFGMCVEYLACVPGGSVNDNAAKDCTLRARWGDLICLLDDRGKQGVFVATLDNCSER